MRPMKPNYSLIALLCLIATVLSACERPTQPHQQKIYVFGTILDITLWGVDEKTARHAFTTLGQEFQTMHHEWHAWEPSLLTALNDDIAAGRPHRVAPSLVPLLISGKVLYKTSGGLFNPTIGHLLNLWGFQSEDRPNHPPPAQEKIAELVRAAPGMDALTIQGDKVSSSNPMIKLDMGGYAKGYGIDLAIERLKKLGIENAIINAGGDLRAIGSKDGKPWRVGVRHPQGKGILATIEISGDQSVFTSGNYERFREWEGVRYQHILDPRTGMPVEGVTSVTVIHDNGIEADAASTALVVAGGEAWHATARSMGIRYAMLVEDDGTLHMNPAMAQRLLFEGERPKRVIISPKL